MTTTETLGESARATSGAQPRPTRGRVTVIANLKGGVSKTTTAVNLSCGLARGIRHWRTGRAIVRPQRVLLIDTEPLGTASTWLGVTAEGSFDSVGALFDEPPGDLLDALLEQDWNPESHVSWRDRIVSLGRRAADEPVDVIPAESGAIDLVDSQKGESEFSLRANLEILRCYYDHIVIDTPANAKNRMLRSALIAADGVVIPVPPSSAVATSVRPLFKILRDIKRAANRSLAIDGWLIANAGSRGDRDAMAAMAALADLPNTSVFSTPIRTLKAIQRSAAARRSVFGMEDAAAAVRDYEDFITEWFARTGGEVTHG